MQNIQSKKSLKNFYIRPTTGVGSKGAFSIDKRENHNIEIKHINQLLKINSQNNNDNVLFSVNSYGFKPTSANQNFDSHGQKFFKKSEIIGNKRQTYPNSDHAINQMTDDFRILVKHKVFPNTTSLKNNNNNFQSNAQIQSNLATKNSPSHIQIQYKYRVTKNSSQDQQKDINAFYDEGCRDKMYSSQGFQKISSPLNYNLNKFNNNQQPQNNQKEQDVPFEDDISEVRPSSNYNQEQKQEFFESEMQNKKIEIDEEDETDAQQEQFSYLNQTQNTYYKNQREYQKKLQCTIIFHSAFQRYFIFQKQEIRTKDNNNDSMNDIQDLATDGFDLAMFKEELNLQKSPLQKFYSTMSQPQLSSNQQNNQSCKWRFSVDSNDNSDTNHSDIKRFSSLQKNSNTNLYNFTQSKLSEQRDETTPSIQQNATNPMTISVNSKENNIQFYNIKQENQEDKASRPITSQNNVSRIKNLQLLNRQNNPKSTSTNFYELFANQNFKMNSMNTYQSQLIQNLTSKQSSKIPFFHNYYRNEQIKNLQQTNTFSVKKAQLFSFQPKQNNLMSRQGQRSDSAGNFQQNAMSSQIQQQLVQGINKSNNRSKGSFSGTSTKP